MVTHTLFGFPVIMTKLDPKSYDKKSIVSAIEKNFKLNKTRNNWDTQSVMHHSYDDVNNPRYHKVKFASLIPVYQKIITNIFKNMALTSAWEFDFKVVNYTCLSKSQYMASHIHPEVDFSAIHYIQFDKKHHTSTTFKSTLPYAPYISTLRPNLLKILSSKHLSNSWAWDTWEIATEEDDFCFFPAFLKHGINPQTSKNKNRITVVLNISLRKRDFSIKQ